MTHDWFDRLERGVTAPVADERKCCPFCGTDVWGVFGPDENHGGECWVECSGEDCGQFVYGATREECIAAWNARALHSDISAALERIKVLEADAARLDFLEQMCMGYGFQDMHEGNRWMIDGPFATARDAIDAAMAAGEQGGEK